MRINEKNLNNPPIKIQNWHVGINASIQNGLNKDSIADCFQIKSISKNRFIKKIGTLNEDEMSNVQIAMMLVLDLV
ncbi:MAG: type II toxin-antitoxin system PemK/MazF family toxin [Bacteroidales bacterium]|nr:type II toxin-antitoxin system PemK/MazF family toxin [Bacteroidales bacterium]